jgi:hypothetical protein
MSVRFSPNLSRPKVFYDAEMKDPLRFREAISALHDVVVGDLRIQKKDRSAYLEWKQQQQAEDEALAQRAFEEAKKKKLTRKGVEIPADLHEQFNKQHNLYWTARRAWAAELSRFDPALFRSLVPCDPVVTVAPDVVFFECFSKDESSYGCLSVDREAFRGEGGSGRGTTNVDYSLALYDHFQTLRTYRPTRLVVDPSGFEVKVEGVTDYKEEKIDLPPSWLRGFGQLQAAMSLPSQKVLLRVEAVYSLLAYLKRNREKIGPRSLRFLLEPGQSPRLVLDPWGVVIPTYGPVYEGSKAEEIKVWGRRRLMVLARLLPLAEYVEVRLLGSGMPSVWIAHLGGMRFTLALSGWTANDWTSGSNLDLLFGSYQADERAARSLLSYLEAEQQASLDTLSRIAAPRLDAPQGDPYRSAPALGSLPRPVLLGSLNLLAKQGQIVYDFATDTYRHRQVMPQALSETLLGPEHPELAQGKTLFQTGSVKRESDQWVGGRRVVAGKAGGTTCEAVFDLDQAFVRAKCTCSYFFKNRLRMGPCRHLLALRMEASQRARV